MVYLKYKNGDDMMCYEEIASATCCFFGHRKIERTPGLEEALYDTIENLINEEDVHTFLFGSKSVFNTLCHEVVTRLKQQHPAIKRIYVRAEFPYIDDDYKAYLLTAYEETYYPAKILGAGKAVYIQRNYEMIDRSQYCVVYYDENYQPQKVKKDIIAYQPRSGTALAYHYAEKEKKIITNMVQQKERNS